MAQLMVSLCVGVTATPVHEVGKWEISEFLSDNHMSSLKTLPNINTRGDSIYYLKYSFRLKVVCVKGRVGINEK